MSLPTNRLRLMSNEARHADSSFTGSRQKPSNSDQFQRWFDRLAIEIGDTIYLSASLNWLGWDGARAIALLDALLDRVGSSGTVLTPSFCFTNDRNRPDEGFVYDVRRSPCMMGMIYEMFRRYPNAYRSENYYLPVCGIGANAERLLQNQLRVVNPLGGDSVYDRMVKSGAKMVGMGVSLNYNVIPHLIDSKLERHYDFPVFETKRMKGTVVDRNGDIANTENLVLTLDVRRRIKPVRVIEQSAKLKSQTRKITESTGAILFSTPARTYYEEALRLGESACKQGLRPPWLEDDERP